MVFVRTLSVAATLVMVVIIIFGVSSGDFSAEAGEILGLAWGKVTLVDLYVGLALFGAWIGIRERRWLPVSIWWVGLVLLGNLAAALYLAVAAFRSRDLTQLLAGDGPAGDPTVP